MGFGAPTCCWSLPTRHSEARAEPGSSVLLGMGDEFVVLQLEPVDPDTVEIVIEVIGRGACPGFGVPTSRAKGRRRVRFKHLAASVNEPSWGGSIGLFGINHGQWLVGRDGFLRPRAGSGVDSARRF